MRATIRVFYVIAAIVPAFFIVSAVRLSYDGYQLRSRLEHLDVTLQSVRIASTDCSPGVACECRVLTHHDVFSGCRVIDGAQALWIRSTDECFKQWTAANRVWTKPDSLGERLGSLWISARPRVVTKDWSVFAIAPCND